MTSMQTPQNRVTAGIPTGGQFAEHRRAEGSVALSADDSHLTDEMVVYWIADSDGVHRPYSFADAATAFGLGADATQDQVDDVLTVFLAADSDSVFATNEPAYEMPNEDGFNIDLSHVSEGFDRAWIFATPHDEAGSITATGVCSVDGADTEAAANALTEIYRRMPADRTGDVEIEWDDDDKATAIINTILPGGSRAPKIIADALSQQRDRLNTSATLAAIARDGYLVGNDALWGARHVNTPAVIAATRVGYTPSDKEAVAIASNIFRRVRRPTVAPGNDLRGKSPAERYANAFASIQGLANGYALNREYTSTSLRNGGVLADSNSADVTAEVTVLRNWIDSKKPTDTPKDEA